MENEKQTNDFSLEGEHEDLTTEQPVAQEFSSEDHSATDDMTRRYAFPEINITEMEQPQSVEEALLQNLEEQPEQEQPEQVSDYLSKIMQEFSAPEQQAEAEEENAQAEEPVELTEEDIPELPIKKGRPKRKKGYGFFGIPHIVSTCIWLAIIIVIGVSVGRTIWACCTDLMAFGKPDQSITITVTDADFITKEDGTKVADVEKIAKKLKNAGLIEYPDLFKFFVNITKKDKNISVGTFTLNSYFDYNAMVNGMAPNAPAREIVTVLIPEGYTCAQIFALLDEYDVCNLRDLEEYAAHGELANYWFLEGVSRGTKYCLEGYLFPDTYDFYTNDDAGRVLGKFLSNFDKRFTDLMKEDFEKLKERYAAMLSKNGYGSDYIAQNQMTIHKLVTLASIVEKETSSGSESFDIASVYYNRLANAKQYPYLDADATVHYAIGDYFGQIKELTQYHLDTQSPYNTRGHQKGLPPGPIANPGIYSLYAVLDPNDTPYHYYLLNPKTGVHEFCKDDKEFAKKKKELGYNS